MRTRQHIIVMGVSGCGKSTVAGALAGQLGWTFDEGDLFHPEANIAKMASGTPLTDTDRGPWLATLAGIIAAREKAGQSSILSCSALRCAYRNILRGGAAHVRFLHLHGAQAVLEERLSGRTGHFFPKDLLSSQFAALEPLGPDEDGIEVDVALALEDQIALGMAWIDRRDC